MDPAALRAQADALDARLRQLASTRESEQRNTDATVQSLQNQIEQLERDIVTHQRTLADETVRWDAEKAQIEQEATGLRRQADEAEKAEHTRKAQAAAAVAAHAALLE